MHRITAYFTLAIIFIIVIIILTLPYLVISRKRGKDTIRQLGYLAFFYSLFLIIFATILYTGIDFKPDEYIMSLQPFKWVEKMNTNEIIVEFIPNIMMFIPIGIFIPIVFRKMRKSYKSFLFVFAITYSIETFQYFIGRSADIDDIIANVTGGMIGYVIFKFCDFVFKDKGWWRRLLGLNVNLQE